MAEPQKKMDYTAYTFDELMNALGEAEQALDALIAPLPPDWQIKIKEAVERLLALNSAADEEART